MNLICELGTAFTKLTLYWKYFGYSAGEKKLLVDIELLHLEPDSPKKWGLLAQSYWKLIQCHNGWSKHSIDHYANQYMHYRTKFLKGTLPLN